MCGKTVIVNNGDEAGSVAVKDISDIGIGGMPTAITRVFQNIDEYFDSFLHSGDDRMIIKGKKISSKSYYMELPLGKNMEIYPVAIFTITKIEITDIIKENDNGKKYTVGDIVEVYEGYAYKENENKEIEMVKDLSDLCYVIMPMKNNVENVLFLYYTNEKQFGSGSANRYFEKELENVWGHDSPSIVSDVKQDDYYSYICKGYENYLSNHKN